MKKLLTTIIVIAAFTSCSNYYKAVTSPEPANTTNINKLKLQERYFILRNGSDAYAMTNISFSGDQQNMTCTLGNLSVEHKLHLTSGRNGQMKYRKANTTGEDETAVLKEVHFYITPDASVVPGPYTLALNKVTKAEVIEEDKKKTKRSHMVGATVGITVAAVAVAAIVVGVAAASFSIF